ncbi:MAG TPA: polyprenyl synthetase family protein [Candidatus Saccharimonadales bacterium]|nr:polyprenyl synthetase family protein [Candidatus Saccharimonadales bacterium]
MDASLSAAAFKKRLTGYKQRIDDDIAAYAARLHDATAKEYGRDVLEAETAVFLDVLQRGGKRIRGALTIVGYEMCGGTNTSMITQVARAIEMLHTYILMIDDIQDRSTLRRGKPTAHEIIATYHKQHHLKGDSAHTGMSLALMSAIAGGHAAQALLANLDADAEARLKAISISNRTLVITAHGQTLDIMNELVARPSTENIERVLEWKTALYTIINPLHVGMVLAGADCSATDAITPFGMHAGKAFQITDDLLGIFGDQKELGKVPGDDIREGKGTLLVAYALQHALPKDRLFLETCLGSQVNASQLAECREIMERSGAAAYARKTANRHIAQALDALEAGKQHWSADGTAFLTHLARALADRVN